MGIYSVMTGKTNEEIEREFDGKGYGDFKLLAAAGAWCGWQTLPMILLIASLGGIGYAIVSQLLQRRTITTIAFGPWLALGSMINLGYLAWISY